MSKLASRPRPEWLHPPEPTHPNNRSYCYGPPDSTSHFRDHVYIYHQEDGIYTCVGPERSDGRFVDKTICGSLYLEVLLLAHEMLLEGRK